MTTRLWLYGTVLLPINIETYHAACIALDDVNKTVYISETFEQLCGANVAACRVELGEKWAAFLKKESLAQSKGATWRCEMYNEGSSADEPPLSRVRKWRDEAVAEAQSGPVKYTKVVQTKFGLD